MFNYFKSLVRRVFLTQPNQVQVLQINDKDLYFHYRIISTSEFSLSMTPHQHLYIVYLNLFCGAALRQ